MKVILAPELERRIAERLESGLYANASEVVCDRLLLLFETLKTEALQDRQLAQLRADIQAGLNQANRSELVDCTVSRERIKAAFAAQVSTRV